MLTFMRQRLGWIMIVLLGLIGISFVFFPANPGMLQSLTWNRQEFGKVDGRALSLEELRHSRQGIYAMLCLTSGARIPETPALARALALEAWMQRILLQDAKRTGLKVTDAEVIAFIKSLPALQGERGYEPQRYQALRAYLLAPMGLSERAFEESVRDWLTAQRMQRKVVERVGLTPAQQEAFFQKWYGSTQVALVEIRASAEQLRASLTPDQISKEVEALQKDPAGRTPERRAAYVARIAVASKGGSHDAAMRDALARAQSIADAIQALPPRTRAGVTAEELAAIGARFNCKFEKTGLLSIQDPLPGAVQKNDGVRNANPVFSLRVDQLDATLVPANGGLMIVALAQVEGGGLLPDAQLRTLAENRLISAKQIELTRTQGQQAHAALQKLMRSGKSFAQAAADLKLSVQTLPATVPAAVTASEKDLRMKALAARVPRLGVGELSPPLETPDSVLIACVTSRAPANSARRQEFLEKNLPHLQEQAQEEAFGVWLKQRCADGRTRPPDDKMIGAL